MESVKIYLLTLAVFFLVDIVWLGVISKNLYKKYLGAFDDADGQLDSRNRFLSAVHCGAGILRHQPGACKGQSSVCRSCGRFFRARRLWDLRFDEPCHLEGLALAYYGHRPCLGHVPECGYGGDHLRCCREVLFLNFIKYIR